MSFIKSSRSNQICGILTLMNLNARFVTNKLKSEEVSERTKILHLEMASKMMFEGSNASDIIATDNHIININQKECVSLRSPYEKEGTIRMTLAKSNLKDCNPKFIKPGPRSLLKVNLQTGSGGQA